jgi:SNF2 family DNA or RNA helicase
MSYEYVYKPFAHQAEGVQLLRGRRFYGFFDEPGCGKSKVVVDGCNLLFLDRAVCAVVVVCPNTVKATWANNSWGQIKIHSPSDFPFEVIRLDSGRRWPERQSYWHWKNQRLVWVITNYEALRATKNETWLSQFLAAMSPAVMVLDESTKIKNRTALQTKAALRIGQHATRRYILTGTPIAKNPLDLYTQCNFLDPRVLKFPSFVAFRNRYAKMGGYMVGGRPVQVVGWQNLDELKEKIKEHSRIIEKKTALPDLPPKLFTRIEVPLSPEQERAYLQMRDHAVATVPGTVGQATATIALTKALRQTQITSGHLTIKDSVTGQDKVVVFEQNPKTDVVMELLEEIEHMVVFCMFITEIQELSSRLRKADISHGLIYGETKNTEREKIQQDYQAGKLRVVVCQVVTGGIGITLTQGSTAVFLTNPYSLEARVQAEDRLHRPSAERHDNVTYYDVCATYGDGKPTIDHSVIKAQEQKEDLSNYVLGRTLEEVL